MVPGRTPRLVLFVVAVASVAAGGEPRLRVRVRTLELRVGRDKKVVGVKPEDAENVKKYIQALKAKAAIYVVPFRQCLEAEAQFIASICEFDQNRREALVDQGHAIADSAVDRLTGPR